MKKKLGIILAILLCVVLALTFVACGKTGETGGNGGSNDGNGGNNGGGKSGAGLSGVTDAQVAEMDASISAYLDSWLLANAQEVVNDQSAVLDAALNKIKGDQFTFTDKDMNDITPTVQVTFNATNNKYTIVVSWNKGALKKTYEKAAKTVTYSNWAGTMNKTDGYTALTEEGEAAGAIDKIVNATFSTINKVGTNAQTAKFGVDGKVGLQIMGLNYMLHIKGNVDLEDASKTEIALMIENTQKVLGGLYYQGAAEDADCKLILQIGDTYKYIDYAILNELLAKVITPAEQPGEDFLPTGTLANVLKEFGANSTIANTVASVIDMLAQAYEKEANGKTTYLIDINLSTVLSQVAELLGDVVTPGMFEGVPYLEKLDLSTMHGLLGHITIAASVTGADKDVLTDFELAVNLPACTFYLNEDETDADAKFDIPSISFAIYVKDFDFKTTGKVENVIPAAAANAEYFSPTNFTVDGDIYVNNTDLDIDSTFRFSLVSSVNPFKPSQAKGSLKILKNDGASFNAETAKNFLTVAYEQSDKKLCASGTVLDDVGTDVYVYDFNAGMDAIKEWLGLKDFNGIKYDENGVITLKSDEELDPGESAKPAMKALLNNKLAKAILSYYSSLKAEKKAQEKPAAGEGEEVGATGGFSVNKIGDYINGFKALYEDLVKDGAINIDTENNSGSIVVTPAVINKVTEAINAMSLIPMTLPTDIDDPEYVKAYFNTADYKDKLYITVKYDGNVYELTFDGSQEGSFSVIFKMTTSNRIYNFSAIGTNSDFTVNYKVTAKDNVNDVKSDTTVRFSNFSANWGAANDGTHGSTNKLTLFTADQKAGAAEFFARDGVATQLVTKLMNFLNGEKVEPMVEGFGKWIIATFLA